MARHYSQEDLRALLEYISSNPTILFPELTEEEKKRVVEKVIEQYEEEKNRDANPELVIDLLKDTAKNLRAPE